MENNRVLKVLSTLSFIMAFVATIGFGYVIISIGSQPTVAKAPTKPKPSTYVLDVTPEVDTKGRVNFIDLKGNKWSYENVRHLHYYAGDEHLLLMNDNATPDNIYDDIIECVY